MVPRKTTEIKNFKLEKEGDFTAVFSTMNVVDKQGDLVLPGAFGEQRVIVSGYGHASWNSGVGALPVGKGRIFEQGNEAIISGQFFLDTIAGNETYKTVKNVGDLQEFSYALPEVESELRNIDGQRVRVLKKIRVPEVSPVLMGASIGTRLLDIKCKKCAGLGDCRTCPRAAEKAELAKIAAEFETRRISYILKRHDERSEIQEVGVRYRPIEANRVSSVVRSAAAKALAGCWFLLGAPWPVSITWVTEETDTDRESFKLWGERFWKSYLMKEPVSGFASPGGCEIFLRKTEDAWAVKHTVAHELAHLVQPKGLTSDEEEAACESFAGSFPVSRIC